MLVPRRMLRSMSSGVDTPSIMQKNASLISGISSLQSSWSIIMMGMITLHAVGMGDDVADAGSAAAARHVGAGLLWRRQCSPATQSRPPHDQPPAGVGFVAEPTQHRAHDASNGRHVSEGLRTDM